MKKLLIVVDYQNDFVTGSLGFPKAVRIEENIYQKIKTYLEEDQEVVFTLDTHYKNYPDTQEGRKLPFLHCEHDTEGWQIYGKVAQLKNEKTKDFSKYTFGSMDLAKYLLGKDYDSIELVGVVTNICVIANAVLAKSALPEAEIIIDAACVASNDEEMEQKSLDVMENLQMQIINR